MSIPRINILLASAAVFCVVFVIVITVIVVVVVVVVVVAVDGGGGVVVVVVAAAAAAAAAVSGLIFHWVQCSAMRMYNNMQTSFIIILPLLCGTSVTAYHRPFMPSLIES